MRLFAIGDVHLPGGPRDKSMDRFGDVWTDHVTQVKSNWDRMASDDDVLMIVGDLSWAMTMDEARVDLQWIAALRGRKVVIRGNHDFWWSGIGKVRAAFGALGIGAGPVTALQHDHVVIDRIAIVGTRGWQCPGSMGSADVMVESGDGDAGSSSYTAQDEKIYLREVGRLRLGLEGLERSGDEYDTLVVALHYPPMNPAHEASGFTELLDEFGADFCVHGHLHGAEAIATAFEGVRGATTYHCVSADAVRQRPRRIVPPPATVRETETPTGQPTGKEKS